MPMCATPEALLKGVVEGLFSSLEVMKDLKFAEICKFVTVTDAVIYPFAVVMNLDRWNGLPDAVKKVMEEMGREQAEWTGTYMDEHVEAAMAWSKETHGVEVISLSPEEKAGWDALLRPITYRWIEDAGAKGLPAEAVIRDILELTRKHSG